MSTPYNDWIIPSVDGTTYRGLDGDDVYIISHAMQPSAVLTLIDISGNDRIQLTKGLTIASSTFLADAAELIFSNGATVRILGASHFHFDVGANGILGDQATSLLANLDYAGFASVLGVSTLPTGSNSVSGTPNFLVQAISTIRQILPMNGPSGTVVTIHGSGFIPRSNVSFDNSPLANPTYVSEHELQVMIPLELDAANHLVPMAPGVHTLAVDNSQTTNFTVTDLPPNPLPPGTVINATTQSLSTAVRQNQTIYQQSLATLRTQLQDPNLLAMLDIVKDLDTNLLQLLNVDLTQALTQIDPTTLATLERMLIAHGALQLPQLSNGIEHPAFAVTATPSVFPGNDWLNRSERNAFLALDKPCNILDPLAKIPDRLASIIGGPTGEIAILLVKLSSLGCSLILDLSAPTVGSIANFDIDAVHPKEITMDAGLFPHKHITMEVSNVDDELGQTRSFINPTIQVEYTLDISNIIKDLWESNSTSYGGPIPSYGSTVLDIINIITEKLALTKSGTQYSIQPPLGPLSIGLDRVEWDDESVFPLQLCQDSIFKDKLTIQGDGSIVVDPAATVTDVRDTNLYIIPCFSRVARAYRTKNEQTAYVRTQFLIDLYAQLNLTMVGEGLGTVTADPSPTAPPTTSTCEAGYFTGTCRLYFRRAETTIGPNPNAHVTLNARAKPEGFFSGWSGSCLSQTVDPDGRYGTCTLPFNGTPQAVTATFNSLQILVDTTSSTGGGVVQSDLSGINCHTGSPDYCLSSFSPHSTVTLTAQADETSGFTGWSGPCVQQSIDPDGLRGTCSVLVDGNDPSPKRIKATFTPRVNLTVTLAGTGTGAVSSTPSGINCKSVDAGSSCSALFSPSAQVELTGTPDAHFKLTNWSGDCSSQSISDSGQTGNCTVRMDTHSKAVTATFGQPYFYANSWSWDNEIGTVYKGWSMTNKWGPFKGIEHARSYFCLDGIDTGSYYTVNGLGLITKLHVTGSTYGWPNSLTTTVDTTQTASFDNAGRATKIDWNETTAVPGLTPYGYRRLVEDTISFIYYDIDGRRFYSRDGSEQIVAQSSMDGSVTTSYGHDIDPEPVPLLPNMLPSPHNDFPAGTYTWNGSEWAGP